MKYYTEKNKRTIRFNKKNSFNKYLAIIIAILFLFNLFFYYFDKRMLPVILDTAEMRMKAEAISMINEESINVFSEGFDYNDIINIEKDDDGNITLLRSNTAMQNFFAAQVVLNCSNRLEKFEAICVDLPIGYLTNNSFFYNMGPSLNIKMKQVGNIITSYESIFESAGINQTRHKIYLNVEMTIRVIVPLKSRDVTISQQIPVADTIIVGKIPDTAINMNGN